MLILFSILKPLKNGAKSLDLRLLRGLFNKVLMRDSYLLAIAEKTLKQTKQLCLQHLQRECKIHKQYR